MSQSVFCICTTGEQLRGAVTALQSHGFAYGKISALLPDSNGTQGVGNVTTTKAPMGTGTGAVTGGLAGGVLGLLVGVGALVIPGLGLFIAAGPIVAALSGALIGVASGGIVGGLISLGFPEIEARFYEARLQNGDFLLSVQVENEEEEERATMVFRAVGGENIASSSVSPTLHP